MAVTCDHWNKTRLSRGDAVTTEQPLIRTRDQVIEPDVFVLQKKKIIDISFKQMKALEGVVLFLEK